MYEGKRTLACVPARNEERLASVVVPLVSMVRQVLIIDDGSVEAVVPCAGAIVHRFTPGRGYGDVVQHGIDSAMEGGYESVIFVDGDGQHDPQYVPRLLAGLTNHDVVIGNRMDPASPEVGLRQEEWRRLIIQLFCATIARLWPQCGIRDCFSGFLAFRVGSVPSTLDLRGSGYSSPMRMWPCIATAGLRIGHVVVPRIYFNRQNGVVKAYASMNELAMHIFGEFIAASSVRLGWSADSVAAVIRSEVGRQEYSAIRDWVAAGMGGDRGAGGLGMHRADLE